MGTKKLRASLEQLRKELQHVETSDAETKKLVLHLKKDLEALLGRPAKDTHYDQAIIGRFQAATSHFEVSHPDLTMILARIINMLSQMGI